MFRVMNALVRLSLKVPGTTKIFGWRVLLDRLLSKVNLVRRMVMVSSNLRPLYNKDVKTLQHLLITCIRLHKNCDSSVQVGLSLVRFINIVNHFCSFYFSELSRKANCA